MTNRGNEVIQAKVKNRSEYFFTAYYALGRSRSLTGLHEVLTGLGLSISLTTLKNYSKKYDWITRAKQLDEEHSSRQEQQAMELAKRVTDMNDRQATAGRALQQMGLRGLQQIQPGNMNAQEVGTLLERGVKIERLASGEATSRHEVAVQMVAPIVREMVVLFQQINNFPDKDRRTKEFAVGADSILERVFGRIQE